MHGMEHSPSFPLHLFSNSLSRFLDDEIVPMIDQSNDGKSKDLSIVAVHVLGEFAQKMMGVGEMIKEDEEKRIEQSDPGSLVNSNGGINTLHIIAQSLSQHLLENLQPILKNAPPGADKLASELVVGNIEDIITRLNITANTLR